MKELRYHRQIIIPGFGYRAQRKLSHSKVAVLGAGGIGVAALAYLSAAGIGSLVVIESDLLEETNLNRQIIYREKDLGQPKASLAVRFLKQLNSSVKIKKISCRVKEEDLVEVFKKCDILIDCSDNFETRFSVNKAAYLSGKPYVFAAVYRREAQLALLDPLHGPCLKCVFSADFYDLRNCSDYGIIGSVAGATGSLAALKAVEYLTGLKKETDKMFIMDFESFLISHVKIKKREECSVCGKGYRNVPDDFSFLSSLRKVTLDFSKTKRENKNKDSKTFHLSLEELNIAASFLDKNAEIKLICERGIKSSIAFSRLKSMGFLRVKKSLR